MTKHIHTPEDSPLGLSLPLDCDTKVEPDITDILEKNALSLCSTTASPIKSARTAKAKSTMVRTRARSKTKVQTEKTRIEKIMNKLCNIEPTAQPEKPLNIDLGVDLYQMEDL